MPICQIRLCARLDSRNLLTSMITLWTEFLVGTIIPQM